MRANMIIEKGATDRRLVHIFIDYKSNRLVLQTGRLFLCLIIILAECVSGTKAGNVQVKVGVNDGSMDQDVTSSFTIHMVNQPLRYRYAMT